MPAIISHFTGGTLKLRHVMCLWSHSSFGGSLGLHYSIGVYFHPLPEYSPQTQVCVLTFQWGGSPCRDIQATEVAASVFLQLLDMAQGNLL